MMRKQAGFIALMSVIIISFVLLLVATSFGFAGILGRFNIYDSELKARSSALADACIDEAILRIANDPDYDLASIDTFSVNGEDCYIFEVDNTGSHSDVYTGAMVGTSGQAYTCYRARVSTTTLEIDEFEELSTDPACAFP